MPEIKDRIKELRRVPASQLIPNVKNWRRHPPSQRVAMAEALNEIGLADAVIAVETDDGLQLLDGHLRQDLLGDTEVPVLIVDLTEDEADKLLLTLDPIAQMATTDTDRLLELLERTRFDSSAIDDMLEGLANGERYPMPDWSVVGTPTTEEIEKRTGELEELFAKRDKNFADKMIHLICPDCGSEFSIQAGELQKDYDEELDS